MLITEWMEAAMEIVDNRRDYRLHLFEKCTIDVTELSWTSWAGLNKTNTFKGSEESSHKRYAETGPDAV